MHKSLKCLSVLALCLLSLGLLLPSSAPAQTGTQPFRTPAWQISVETNSYVYPDGAGANWTYIKIGTSQTGKNVQAVFNWLDSNWAQVVSQVLVTNLWTNLFPTASTVQATFDYIDQTYGTSWVSLATANGLYIGRTNRAVVLDNMGTNSVSTTNIVDGTIRYEDMNPNVSNTLATTAAVSNKFLWDANRHSIIYDARTVACPSNGTACIISNFAGSVDSDFCTLNGSGNTLTFSKDGLYLVRAELHWLGSDPNFRDSNKEAWLLLNGTQRIINFGTVGNSNSVLSSFGIVNITNTAYIQLAALSYYTATTTNDYARIDIIPLGAKDAGFP